MNPRNFGIISGLVVILIAVLMTILGTVLLPEYTFLKIIGIVLAVMGLILIIYTIISNKNMKY
jgi:hypothetical protein